MRKVSPTLRISRDVLCALAGAAVAVIMLTSSPAVAHAPGTYYYSSSPAGIWPDNHTEGFFIRNTFPVSAWTTRIVSSASAWTNAAGTDTVDPDFSYAGLTTATGDFDHPCNVSWSGVYYHNPGTDLLGQVKWCKSGSTLISFSLAMSSAISWYTGTGTPPLNQYDSQGATTHEFGHATGWAGHLPTGDCPTLSSSQPTMCEVLIDNDAKYRTLELHDTHTFDAAY